MYDVHSIKSDQTWENVKSLPLSIQTKRSHQRKHQPISDGKISDTCLFIICQMMWPNLSRNGISCIMHKPVSQVMCFFNILTSAFLSPDAKTTLSTARQCKGKTMMHYRNSRITNCFQHVHNTGDALLNIVCTASDLDSSISWSWTAFWVDLYVNVVILTKFFELGASLPNDTTGLALMNQHLQFCLLITTRFEFLRKSRKLPTVYISAF